MRAIRVPLLFLLALVFSRPAAPGSIGLTWQGVPPGNWTDARWAGSSGPVAFFPNNNSSDTYQVTIPGSSVTLGTSVTVDTLNLTGGELTLATGGSLALAQAGSTNAAALVLSGGTLTGNGGLTNAAGGMIAGAGTLDLTLTNNAVIQASGGTLHLSGIHVWNTNGTIRALNGSTVRMTTPTTGGRIETVGTGALQLDSTFTDSAIVNSAGGAVSIVSVAQLLGASTLTNAGTLNIAGGKLLHLFPGSTMQNSGAVNITSGTLILAGAGSSNSGTIAVDAGTLALGADFSNSGAIQLGGTSGGIDVFAPASLSGYGTLSLAGRTINVQGGASLTNAANTIHGTGTISGALSNQSMMRANGGTLTLSLAAGSSNTGIMEAAGGGLLHINAVSLSNTNGLIRALNGSTVRMTTPTTGGLIETVGTGALQLDSTFTDSAIVNSAGGTVSIVSVAQLLGASTLTNAGILNIASGKLLHLFPGSTMQNSGAVNVTSGTLILAGAGSSNSGTIAVDAGALALGANFSNSGTIQLGGTSGGMDVVAPATLSGTGSVSLAGRTIRVLGGASLTNDGNTIEGFGTVTGVLDNQGVVRASGGPLTLTLGASTNSGTMEAAAGGLLQITGAPLTNTNGTIRALDGSTARITTPTSGGQIQTVGTGVLELDSTFTDAAITNSAGGTVSLVSVAQLLGASTLTNAGTLNIASGKLLHLFPGSTMLNSGAVNITSGTLVLAGAGSSNSGTIAVDAGTFALGANFSNSGTIQLNGTSSGVDVFAPTTLSGSGSVALAGGTINVMGGATLTNAGNTIEGFGRINGALNNQGEVRATGGALTIENLTNLSGNTLTGGTYYVAGTLELLGATSIWDLGANVTLDGTGALVKNGAGGDALAGLQTIKSGALLALLNGASIGAGGGTLSNHGLLSGNGTINGDLFDAGILSPGMSPGVLTITGNYTQDPAGNLNIEIGGGSLDQFDRLIVTHMADFNGILNISLINGFRPYNGQTFTILSFAGVDDRFSSVNGLDYGPGLGFVMDWHATDLTLRWETPEPGTWLLAAAGLALLALRARRR